MADTPKQQVLPTDPNDDDMFERAKRYAVEYSSAFPQAYDVQTRRQIQGMTGADLTKGVVAGTHTVQAGASVPVISPTGQPGTVPADKLAYALSQGFQVDDPNNMAARRMAKEHPTWTGFVAGLHGASEGTLGIPEAIASTIDPRLDDPIVKAIQAKAAVDHPNIALGGRIGGEVLTAVGTAGLGDLVGVGRLAAGAEGLITGAEELTPVVTRALGAGATGLEKAGLSTLAGETASATPSLLRSLAGAGVREGIQGAAMQVPEATRQLFNGDPDKAAESLMWGAGLGAMFGVGGKLLRSGIEAGAPTIERLTAAKLKDVAANPGEALGTSIGNFARRTTTGLGMAAGHAVGIGGLGGLLVTRPLARMAGNMTKDAVENWMEGEGGAVAKKWLKEMAEAPLERGWGEGMASQAVSSAAQRLAKVPSILSSIATQEIEHKEQTVSEEQAMQLGRQAQMLASNPQMLLDATSNIAAPFAHSPAGQAVATSLQGKLMTTIGYIADNTPKHPAPAPFQKDMWTPSPLEIAALQRKLEVVMDPYIVIHRMADGTLTQDHVDALAALYPKTYEDLQKTVMETSTKSNAPILDFAQRQKLGMLMRSPLDRLQTPQAVQMLQSQFQVPPPPGPAPGPGGAKRGAGRPPKLEASKLPGLETSAMKSEFGLGGKGGR